MKPQRIEPTKVLFIDHVPRLSGAEQSLLDLVEGLSQGPVEPVVVLPSDGPLAAELRARGILVRMVPMSRRMVETSRQTLAAKPFVVVARLFAFLMAGLRIYRLVREIRPKIVHTNTLKAHLIAILPCTIARVPLVWHVRDILPEGWLRRAFLWCSRFASLVIVPSRAAAEPFNGYKNLHRKLRLIPNGVHVDDFRHAASDRSLREMLGVAPADPVVGIVARVAEWKGQDVFVRAAAMVAPRYPKAHFVIVGSVLFPENDTAFEWQLQRMILDWGLEDRVTFLGWQPAPEAMAACDIVVHASLEPEPFGRSIIEAMAAGKPVIAAAGGAVAEILPPAAGYIVPPGRPELLADALDRLLDDRKLRKRMGEAGQSVAESFFPVARTVQGVAMLYRALAQQAAQRQARKANRFPALAKRRAAKEAKARRKQQGARPQPSAMTWQRPDAQGGRGRPPAPRGFAPHERGFAPDPGGFAPPRRPGGLDPHDPIPPRRERGSVAFEEPQAPQRPPMRAPHPGAPDRAGRRRPLSRPVVPPPIRPSHAEPAARHTLAEPPTRPLPELGDLLSDDPPGYEPESFEPESFEPESFEPEVFESEAYAETDDESEDVETEVYDEPDEKPARGRARTVPATRVTQRRRARLRLDEVGIDDEIHAPAVRLDEPEHRVPIVAGAAPAAALAPMPVAPARELPAPAAEPEPMPYAPPPSTALPFPLPPAHVFARRPLYDVGKRIVDVALSLVVLVVGLPVWLLVAVLIKLDSPGPVFYTATVYGRDSKPFRYVKFRSMRIDGDDNAHRSFIHRYVREGAGHDVDGKTVYKLMGDDRVTPVGRVIRALSLDEIPQLLNVLRGDMSIVGPRPPLDYEFDLYDERAKLRLTVLPGITGLQQVAARHEASFVEKLRLDLDYIGRRSVLGDLAIIARTIPAALRGH